MPINKSNEKLSIEFGYLHEVDPNNVISYELRFTHGEIGEVVQILNGLYEPVELPAKMFLEVAEYLISKGVLEGLKPGSSVSKPMGKLSIPSIRGNPTQISNNNVSVSSNTLPVMSIFSNAEDVSQEKEIEKQEETKTKEDIEKPKEDIEKFKQQRLIAQGKSSGKKLVRKE